MLSNRTMLMFKPDCVAGFRHGEDTVRLRHLLNQVAAAGSEGGEEWRMEMGARVHITENMAAKLYEEHKGKPFCAALVNFVTSAPSFVSVWSCEGAPAWEVGRGAVGLIRSRYGRDDLSVTGPANLLHGSDGPESAKREVRWAIKCFILRCAEEG